jgi:hypothetical protein
MAPTRREIVRATTAGALCAIVSPTVLDAMQRKDAAPVPTPAAALLMESFGLRYPIFEAPHGRETCRPASGIPGTLSPCAAIASR